MILKIPTEEISDFKVGENMSLNTVASGERLHIGFFGMRNAGKSSLVNAITGQEVSLVSDVKGTTTDPVKKAMELLPVGPVVIIDTPGLDDEGTLGEMRVKKAKEILKKTDLAVLVVDAKKGLCDSDNEMISVFDSLGLPYLVVYNKADLIDKATPEKPNEIFVSAKDGVNIHQLKELIAKSASKGSVASFLLDDIIEEGDTVILVTPIDESAPKGRIILPQQLVLRNILDNHCSALVCRETELENTLKTLIKKPDLIITDSQVFSYVSKLLPENIKLTSFSIIMARYKGELNALVAGASVLDSLEDGDKILISEGCTHHRQCNDIGTVKLPRWINGYSGKELCFDFSSGGYFPERLSDYRLVVHCGGCMLGEKEMHSRLRECKQAGVPVVNYGVAIAMMNGILKRSLEIFPDALRLIGSTEE